MILSALLVTVGINLGLCFLFVAIYSVLRKQPKNAPVYSPRLAAEGKAQKGGDFNLERLLPTAGWLKRAWTPSEDELLSVSGLDGFVFMRIFIFSLKVFAFAAAIGIFILLPFNFMGNQLNFDFSGFQNKTLESFTISNVDNGSNRLWIHFCAVYVFTILVCCLLYLEYDYISSKKMAHFYSSSPLPNQFTVLVRSIPVNSGRSISESVENFFGTCYPSTYLSHFVVRRTSRLKKLISDADKVHLKLLKLKSGNHGNERFKRPGFMGLFGPRVDLLEYHGKKLEEIEENVRSEQSSLEKKEVPAAFVSFKTRLAAAIAVNIRQGVIPTEWTTEAAPDPQDVYWPLFSASFVKRWSCSLIAIIASIVLTVLFFIPVLLVQGLTHLDQLEAWFPFLKSVLKINFVSQVITGYLPSLVLQGFLHFVPPVMFMLSSIEGHIALSETGRRACTKVLLFSIWNIFFANVLSGTALSRLNDLLQPKELPRLLAIAVPGQASFFIAYVVTSGWTSIASELLRLFPLLNSFMRRNFFHEDLQVPTVPYHSEIPRILLFSLLGVTYFFLAPLILPFVLVYFCMGYIIYRNQVLNVYAPKYETGGKYWPVVHDSTIFSLVLMHIIAIGIFALKRLPLASSLTFPLPILTLVFNNYCQRRFLPSFKALPAECLIKRDRDDEKDPAMSSFYEKLATAYKDPALNPIQRATNNNDQSTNNNDQSIHTPLLASAPDNSV